MVQIAAGLEQLRNVDASLGLTLVELLVVPSESEWSVLTVSFGATLVRPEHYFVR